MRIDDNFKSRVSLARRSANLTQGELAVKIGVVRRQVAAYEAGDSKPRQQVLINIASALGTTAEWLAMGIGDSPDFSKIKTTITVPEIPIYTQIQASFLKSNKAKISPVGFIPAPKGANENSFALELRGDSMVSDSSISFCDGMIITFDTELNAENGSFVLVDSTDNLGATFRRLNVDQGKKYLTPLNNIYPSYELNSSMEVIGVAIHAQYDLSQHKVNNQNEIFHPINKQEECTISERLDKIESMLEKLVANSAQQTDK
ncbi:XRE family transcriptional regulator [Proteus sp. TJ1640]|uniref:LexA family transcriptional regulator n=1 Tax=Proteus sp. TJ1640 TaxID=2050968 RepID=UPI000D68C42A|nr:XRE family transcriptional regulator [Proteus sp. TJ1640]